MKKILIATAAFALLGAPTAFAQPDQGRHQDRGGGQSSGAPQGGQSYQGGGYQGPPTQGGSPQGGQTYPGTRYQAPSTQGQSYQTQQYQGQPQRGGPPGQGVQPAGRPDWNAYLRNNPDLQRAYEQNRRSSTYTETPQAFAQRHYFEHGQTEGRSVPMQQGGQWTGGRQGPNGQWQGGQFRGQDRADHRNWGQLQRNVYAQRRFHFGSYERPRGWYYRRWGFGEFLPWYFWSQNYWINDYAYFGLPYPPYGCVWIRYGDDALLIDSYTGQVVEAIYGLYY